VRRRGSSPDHTSVLHTKHNQTHQLKQLTRPPKHPHLPHRRSAPPPAAFIPFNTARPYHPDLGFFVAVDGAHRINRLLPTAALVGCAPPGGFYQDQPVVEDVKVRMRVEGGCWLLF
jgi:hypothetical protein